MTKKSVSKKTVGSKSAAKADAADEDSAASGDSEGGSAADGDEGQGSEAASEDDEKPKKKSTKPLATLEKSGKASGKASKSAKGEGKSSKGCVSSVGPCQCIRCRSPVPHDASQSLVAATKRNAGLSQQRNPVLPRHSFCSGFSNAAYTRAPSVTSQICRQCFPRMRNQRTTAHARSAGCRTKSSKPKVLKKKKAADSEDAASDAEKSSEKKSSEEKVRMPPASVSPGHCRRARTSCCLLCVSTLPRLPGHRGNVSQPQHMRRKQQLVCVGAMTALICCLSATAAEAEEERGPKGQRSRERGEEEGGVTQAPAV